MSEWIQFQQKSFRINFDLFSVFFLHQMLKQFTSFTDVSYVPTCSGIGQVPLDNPPANALCWHPRANVLAYGADEKERDREYGAIKLVNVDAA